MRVLPHRPDRHRRTRRRQVSRPHPGRHVPRDRADPADRARRGAASSGVHGTAVAIGTGAATVGARARRSRLRPVGSDGSSAPRQRSALLRRSPRFRRRDLHATASRPKRQAEQRAVAREQRVRAARDREVDEDLVVRIGDRRRRRCTERRGRADVDRERVEDGQHGGRVDRPTLQRFARDHVRPARRA